MRTWLSSLGGRAARSSVTCSGHADSSGHDVTRLWRAVCLAGLLSISPAVATAQTTADPDWSRQIDIADLKRHVGFLASNSLEGRAAGSRGNQAAAAYLAAEFRRLGLETEDQGTDFRQVFQQGYTNVIARLTGTDPKLRDEQILIGAHFDHVGFGNASNSFGPLGQIHNGADDNASGTAVILELAQALKACQPAPSRTILFCLWDAEEAGMLGSKHWTASRRAQLSRVRLAINLDMVGRMRDNRVNIMGWRSAAGLRDFVARANQDRLDCQFDWAVTSDSDHYSFYAVKIPILHFDTGKHDDYHRPSDDVERIEWLGMERLGRTIARIVRRAADDDRLPEFRLESWTERPPAVAANPRPSPAPRLGVTWNPKSAEAGVIEVVTVEPQSAAERAGVRIGDQLIDFNGWTSGTMDDLRAAVVRAPREVVVRWKRPGLAEELSATVVLAGQPIRCGLTYRLDPTQPGCGVIETVTRSSPAELAGLQPGDVLRAVNGSAPPAPTEFESRMLEVPDECALEIDRNGRLEARILKLHGSGVSRSAKSAASP